MPVEDVPDEDPPPPHPTIHRPARINNAEIENVFFKNSTPLNLPHRKIQVPVSDGCAAPIVYRLFVRKFMRTQQDHLNDRQAWLANADSPPSFLSLHPPVSYRSVGKFNVNPL